MENAENKLNYTHILAPWCSGEMLVHSWTCGNRPLLWLLCWFNWEQAEVYANELWHQSLQPPLHKGEEQRAKVAALFPQVRRSSSSTETVRTIVILNGLMQVGVGGIAVNLTTWSFLECVKKKRKKKAKPLKQRWFLNSEYEFPNKATCNRPDKCSISLKRVID